MLNYTDNDFMRIVYENFPEIDGAAVLALPEKDERYAELKKEQDGIDKKYPDIESWLEGSGPLTLTAEEHAALSRYMLLATEMESIERLAIYYAGHRDCFAYMKTIGMI